MIPTTQSDKELWYRKGWFSFKPPPVPTVGWSREGWIRYIDHSGQWWERPEAAVVAARQG